MLSRIWSSTTLGVDAVPVEIEVNVGSGMPRYTVVGLPDSAVRESEERIRAALKNSGFAPPRGAITINLAPADLRKEGSAFDLPIALGLLAADGTMFDVGRVEHAFIMGELALDGSVRQVPGVLPMTIGALQSGRRSVLVPRSNAAEAAVVEGIAVYPVSNITEAVAVLRGDSAAPEVWIANGVMQTDEQLSVDHDFADVRGQENVKRALEVAAAGGHNVLMVGAPGAGKTMLARRLPGILPPLSRAEALETTKIHSVGGNLMGGHGLVTVRPFRAPHHTISDVGLCGGGAPPRPGEISLAHNGVLFLDELPEFKRHVLEVLRQPLEEGAIVISRARYSVAYPARFMMVASMNPCPCGHRNDPTHGCTCNDGQIARYLSRLSGPLLDRIDLHIEVTPVPFDELSRRRPAEASTAIRARVQEARERQAARFSRVAGIHCNAQMSSRMVRTWCELDVPCHEIIKNAVQRMGLSARAFDRILKVARTISDLAGADDIHPEHLAEAIQYRTLDRTWSTEFQVPAR